ncbi:hypothetical protein M124_2928 [Bacteroides fragilis str. 3988T(B)14]|uniref:Transmembrane protein n=1 Tax=Bacteroides fragilis str. 3988T(B)14 TaxID=1339315 RepID=A0A015SM75_BACFG|nr:hypothetical protein M124_2928 [Bacteroides fragilis str. 3988T(B)14]
MLLKREKSFLSDLKIGISASICVRAIDVFLFYEKLVDIIILLLNIKVGILLVDFCFHWLYLRVSKI